MLKIELAEDTRVVISRGNGAQDVILDQSADTEVADLLQATFVCKGILQEWKWYEWLLYIVFLPVVGVFNTLLMNTDPWYSVCNPFVLSHRLIAADSENVKLVYRKASYNKKEHTFSSASVVCEGAEISNLQCVPDKNDLRLAIFAFCRRVVSVWSLLINILIALIVFASKGKTAIIMIVSALIVLMPAAGVAAIIYAYCDYKKAAANI